MRRLAVILALCLSALSCSHRVYPTASTDSSYGYQRDSIYIHDSVFVEKNTGTVTKNDTVYITKTEYRYRERWREREKTDTLYVHRTDTVTEYVEKELTWFQNMQIWCGRILLLLVALLVGYVIIKIIINARK